MLRIHPQSYEDFLAWCGLLGADGISVPASRHRVPQDAPWLDAPYQDLPLEYLNRLLSWEGIGGRNLVAGLPGINRSQRVPTSGMDELFIFSVRGLLFHLKALEPAAFQRAMAAGSLAEYNREVAASDDQLTEEQDLALTIAEIAEFCLINDFVLAFRY